jgi:hypothetical protein
MPLSDEGAVSSEEELSGGELEVQEASAKGEDRDLKDRLLRRFGSHIGTLKLEFSKKKKKGKLPKEARQALLHWWSVHYKWPYPTVLVHYLNHIFFFDTTTSDTEDLFVIYNSYIYSCCLVMSFRRLIRLHWRNQRG